MLAPEAGSGRPRKDKYWATEKVDQFLPIAMAKVKDHEQYIASSSLFRIMHKSCENVQGGLRFHELLKGGKRGQYDLVRVNDYGNIFGHTHNAICGQRPAFTTRARSGDFTSRGQTKASDGLIEFYCLEKNGETHHAEAIEDMLKCGEGYRLVYYDDDAGKLIDVDKQTERPRYEGDIIDQVVHPVDVVRDWNLKRYANKRWLIIRTRVNKWDLAALHADDPEKHTAILNTESDSSQSMQAREIRLLKQTGLKQDDSDEIDVYHFLHDRTPSLPFGRWVTFIDAKTVLRDDQLEKRGVEKIDDVVLRAAAFEITNVPAGYTIFWDLLALQQAINIGESICLTTMNRFGLQHLSAPAGGVVSSRDVSEGLTIWQIKGGPDGGEVKGINFMALPEVLLKLIDRWRTAMETISGVNSVTRGQPEASLKSGAALALVDAKFLQFSAGPQRAAAFMWSAYGTALVKLFRKNVKGSRLVSIAGKGSEAYVAELKADDLSGVDRVIAEPATALSRLPAGRRDIAETLLTAGLIDAEEFMHVLESGELNSIIHRSTVEPNYVQRENEHLLDPSKPVPEPIAEDNFELHMPRHLEILFDPEVRDDPQGVILARVLEHMKRHKIAQAQKLAGAMPPPGMPGAPVDPAAAGGAPPVPGTEPPLPGAGVPAGGEQVPLDTINPATGAPASVRMPSPEDAYREAGAP